MWRMLGTLPDLSTSIGYNQNSRTPSYLEVDLIWFKKKQQQNKLNNDTQLYHFIDPITVTVVLLSCRSKWQNLVKYDVTSIVSITWFNYLLIKTSESISIRPAGERSTVTMKGCIVNHVVWCIILYEMNIIALIDVFEI